MLGDIILMYVSVILASWLRLGMVQGWDYVLGNIASIGGWALIYLIVFYIAGMYERPAVSRAGKPLLTALVAVSFATILVILIFYARFEFSLGRGILFMAALLFLVFSILLRRLYRTALGQNFLAQNTLIVGEGDEAESVIRLLKKTPDADYRLFGVVTCYEGAAPGDFVEDVPILGHMDSLEKFVQAYSIEAIVVATSMAREMSLLRALRPLRYSGVALLDYTGLYEELSREIPLDHIDDEWLMNAAMNSSRIHILKLKRTLDVTAAAIGLILSLPFTLLAAILIPLDSRGPLLFRQQRCGQSGKTFTVLKFRTMVQDAEKDGAVWAGKQDARVTRVGRFLRTTRIDEIPQLINVLRGEMSLVGPRPERPEFVHMLSETIPFYQERLVVPPGVTGWAQVMFPYAASVEATRRKLQFDLYYIKHVSLSLDLMILLRTVKTILVGLRHAE